MQADYCVVSCALTKLQEGGGKKTKNKIRNEIEIRVALVSWNGFLCATFFKADVDILKREEFVTILTGETINTNHDP